MAASDRMRERFFHCVSGFWAGASIGAMTKGMAPDKVFRTFGGHSGSWPEGSFVDAWQRGSFPPSGLLERNKLVSQAILEKQDRIRAEDLGSVWYRFLSPEHAEKILQPYEKLLLEMILAKMPATEVGRYSDYSGLNSFACACLPIALMNSGDPEHAREDAENVGCLYQSAGSSGVKWAAAAAVAISSALGPQATMQGVLEDVFRLNDSDAVRRDLQKGLEATAHCGGVESLQAEFDTLYHAEGIPYAMSFSKETVTKALCIFRLCEANVKMAAVYGAATGRDADSTASLAASISGALGGCGGLPPEWIGKLDSQDKANAHTFRQFSVNSLSDELYQAFCSRVGKLRTYVNLIDECS